MFHNVIQALLMVMCLCALLALLYIVTAKRFEDRVVGSNLVGTIVINTIAVLAIFLDVTFIVDVALVFAFLSFLAAVVLCRLLLLQVVEKRMKAGKRFGKKGGRLE